jgi:hypothetical protein
LLVGSSPEKGKLLLTPARSSGTGDAEPDGATAKDVDKVAVTVTMVVVITTSDAGEIRGAGVVSVLGSVSVSGSVSASGSVPSRLPRPRVSPRGKPCRFAIGEATSESYSEGTTGP